MALCADTNGLLFGPDIMSNQNISPDFGMALNTSYIFKMFDRIGQPLMFCDQGRFWITIQNIEFSHSRMAFQTDGIIIGNHMAQVIATASGDVVGMRIMARPAADSCSLSGGMNAFIILLGNSGEINRWNILCIGMTIHARQQRLQLQIGLMWKIAVFS